MGWMNDLKNSLNLIDEKHLLYVNFSPINQSIVASKSPVIILSQAVFKRDVKNGNYVLCVNNKGEWHWLTSHLSNYKQHIKNKHDLRYTTIYSIGGKFKI
jgi:hypothetical protein